MHAVVLVGGKGTRLRPLTDSRPKALVPFMGAPYAAGHLRRLRDAGCRQVTYLVGAEAGPYTPLRAVADQLGVAVEVCTEEGPLDTAGAARRLLSEASAAALVCNGDVLTDLDYRNLIESHERTGAVATLALTRIDDTSSFGVVVCDPAGRVQRFVEKPPRGTESADTVNAGTYVIEPAAFRGFAGDGPLSFEREVFPGLVAAGQPVTGLASAAFWTDLGTPRRYLDGQRAVLDGRCAWPAAGGMSHVAGLAAVHESAIIAADARLGPSVVVGGNCRIDARAVLADTAVHDGATVGEGAVLTGTIVAGNAQVGDGAVLSGVVLAESEVVPPRARRQA